VAGTARSLGLTADRLDGPAAIKMMLNLYVDVQADDVDLDADCDMLPFQYGTR